jgi:hypothetical protein
MQSKNIYIRVSFIVQKLVFNVNGNYVLHRALSVMGCENLKNDIFYTIKSLRLSFLYFDINKIDYENKIMILPNI